MARRRNPYIWRLPIVSHLQKKASDFNTFIQFYFFCTRVLKEMFCKSKYFKAFGHFYKVKSQSLERVLKI